jgi:uncharacterized RDD family membrane protein YckC
MTYPPPPPNDPYGNQQPPPPYGAPGNGAPGYGAPAYGQQGGYGAPSAAYASWIQRVGAYLIDYAPVLVFNILAQVTGRGTDDNGLPTTNAMYYLFSLIGLIIWGYNRWFQAGKTGQSWGKKALNLRLVSEQTGQPIGIGLAVARDFAHFIDSIICFIGFLFPLWDAKKQTIADKLVKTLVVTA